jgi:hypothetical protein
VYRIDLITYLINFWVPCRFADAAPSTCKVLTRGGHRPGKNDRGRIQRVEEAALASKSLYLRVLGPRFEELPPVLQRFHNDTGGGRARGTFRVERGPGRLRDAVATLLGLPRAGDRVAVRLRIVKEKDRERWIRYFGEQRVSTTQWDHGEVLLERNGPVSFSSELVIRGSRLMYKFRRAWLAGIPLPLGLSPYIDSYVDAGENGWRVVVHVFAPFLGEIVHYEGWVEPE